MNFDCINALNMQIYQLYTPSLIPLPAYNFEKALEREGASPSKRDNKATDKKKD